MSDYLWDGSGEPDVAVRRLEETLRPLRGRAPAPELPGPTRPVRVPPDAWRVLAAAAAVALALAAMWTRTHRPADGWAITWLQGGSWDDARVVREARIRPGEWIFTGDGRARLSVGTIGEADLEPGTRVSLVDAGRTKHRLSLSRGTLHALIWAPPGQFLVETPSAVAVDLGCRYTLEVADDGSGVLHVEAGWVGFEHEGLRSLVPARAVGDTRPGRGPGTPHYEDASPALSAALDVLDFGPPGPPRRKALTVVLAEARARDALSLWHLLSRLDGEERARVHDRLASLLPPPPGVTRAGILAGDQAMLDAWWAELGLGSAGFWRAWTAPWNPSTSATPSRRSARPATASHPRNSARPRTATPSSERPWRAEATIPQWSTRRR
jgi:hypothetical protein